MNEPILRNYFTNSLYSTSKYLLNYKDLNPYTHSNVIKALEASTKRKLIVMPRGTFKSSICSVGFPIWSLLKNPNERILLDSEIYSNSKNFLREIKMHLTNALPVRLFGEFKTQDCWNEGEIIIRHRTKIFKEASITASGIGAEKTGQHYSIVIADDLNSPGNSSTKEGREKVIDHFRYLTSIMEPDATLVVVATRYNELDIPGFILSNEIGDKREGLI